MLDKTEGRNAESAKDAKEGVFGFTAPSRRQVVGVLSNYGWPMNVSATRIRFARIVDTLLSSDDEQALQAAVGEWHAWATGALGDDGKAEPAELERETRLATGRALGALEAARCVLDFKRTTEFLRAVDEALAEARRRFPGETIHLVEAGSGPLAALALPFAVRYPAERLQFTLLDAHGVSLEWARRLTEELGATASLRAAVQADAATYRFSEEERPHVIACEVLQRALADEPQVAVTRNLAPQLRAGGMFVPRRIEVRVGLFDAAARFGRRATESGVRELAKVFALDAQRGMAPADRFPWLEVEVPRHRRWGEPLHFLTRIELHGGRRLDDFDCALNMPEPIEYPEELAKNGGVARFRYRPGSKPGWQSEFAIASDRAGSTISPAASCD